MSFEEFKPIMSNKNMWKAKLSLPIERINDDDFIKFKKRELVEILVRSYVEKVDLKDLHFDMVKSEVNPLLFDMSVIVDDLLNLKKENRKLRNEISEIVDKYIILRDSK